MSVSTPPPPPPPSSPSLSSLYAPVIKEISLSETQGKALQQFDEWFAKAKLYYRGRTNQFEDKDDCGKPPISQVFRIFGFAGSGKTTIAARKAQDLRGVLAATFTGKAALVMRKKGFSCSTIHSLIYKPEMVPVIDPQTNQPTGEEHLEFVLNDESDLWNAPLLIVDEVSMVGEDIGKDLLSFNRPILVLGDPGQLPPISGAGYFTKGQPNVMLTEIHRQALESPIIKLSMDVRLGRGAKFGQYGDSKVIRKAQLKRESELVAADQVLCGLNRTRRTLNLDMRRYLGFDLAAQPMVGDKLICLRNNRQKRLFNGGMWQVSAPPQFDGEVFELRLNSLDQQGVTIGGGLHKDNQIKVPLEFFIGEEDKLEASRRRKFDEFDFGYCITTHKSQGSQWDHVLVMNENYCFRESAVQWLYTAITRAAERLTLVI